MYGSDSIMACFWNEKMYGRRREKEGEGRRKEMDGWGNRLMDFYKESRREVRGLIWMIRATEPTCRTRRQTKFKKTDADYMMKYERTKEQRSEG
jgi:aminoglycoside phosphotransferase family enzyme